MGDGGATFVDDFSVSLEANPVAEDDEVVVELFALFGNDESSFGFCLGRESENVGWGKAVELRKNPVKNWLNLVV